VVKPVDFYPTKKYPFSLLIHCDLQGRTKILLVCRITTAGGIKNNVNQAW